jgi:hypothetical protein
MDNAFKNPNAHGRLHFFGYGFGHPSEFVKKEEKTFADGRTTKKEYSKRDDIVFYDGNCALFQDGTTLAWLEKTEILPAPKEAKAIVQIASGWSHFIALCEDGTVFCWGTDDAKKQTKVPSNLEDVVAVSASKNASHALTKNGEVVSWGDKSDTTHPKNLKDIVQISGSIGLSSNGKVVPWGLDDFGEVCYPPQPKLPKIRSLTRTSSGFDGRSASAVISVDGKLKGIGPRSERLDRIMGNVRSKIKKASIAMGGFDCDGAFVLFENGIAEYFHFEDLKEDESGDTYDDNSRNPGHHLSLIDGSCRVDSKKYANVIDLGIAPDRDGLWVLVRE